MPFYVATNFTKLYISLVLKCRRKKFGPIFKEFYNFLPKKLSLSSQKYGFGIRDPRSGKNLFRIPDPGVKKAPDPRSGSATLEILRILATNYPYIYHKDPTTQVHGTTVKKFTSRGSGGLHGVSFLPKVLKQKLQRQKDKMSAKKTIVTKRKQEECEEPLSR
jgi:hypothetical protein